MADSLSLGPAGPTVATASPTADQLTMLARLGIASALLYALMWWWQLDWNHIIPRDGTGLVIGRDFISFWVAGHLAWDSDPARFYDLATYQAHIATVAGPNYPGQVWSYPPSIMLLAWPLNFLPYLPALMLWTLIGPLVFLTVVSRWTRSPMLLLAAMLCPAAVFGLVSGQIAYPVAALVLTILGLRQSRPLLAGVLLGLLTIKPHLGLFFPLLLLAERNWRMIFAAAASGLAIALLTALIWGSGVWVAYFTEGVANQTLALSDPQALLAPFMPTVLMNLRGAGVGLPMAQIVQLAASVLAASLILWHFRSRPSADNWRDNAGFLAAAVLGTPYMLSYDTLALVTAMLLAVATQPVPRLLVLGCWLLASLQLALAPLGVPGSALVPLLAAVILLRRPGGESVERITPPPRPC